MEIQDQTVLMFPANSASATDRETSSFCEYRLTVEDVPRHRQTHVFFGCLDNPVCMEDLEFMHILILGVTAMSICVRFTTEKSFCESLGPTPTHRAGKY